jgi:hypothetical protein
MKSPKQPSRASLPGLLQDHRRMLLVPHKLLRLWIPLLREFALYSYALGQDLGDERWFDAASALREAADVLAKVAR